MEMSITFVIIGITTLVSLFAFGQPQFVSRTIFNPWVIERKKEYHRFVTSGFIHKDYVHLFFNMISFYFFGPIVEETFSDEFGSRGRIYFILFYLLAIVVADVPTYFKQRNNPGYNALGASGGVSAVIFASILFQPLNNICFYFAICMPGFILGGLYLIYSYGMGRNKRDNINHDAHLYGALFGLVFCIIMYPASLGHFWDQISNWSLFR